MKYDIYLFNVAANKEVFSCTTQDENYARQWCNQFEIVTGGKILAYYKEIEDNTNYDLLF